MYLFFVQCLCLCCPLLLILPPPDSGTNADGSARLVRCIAPVVGTDCSGTAVNDGVASVNYNVPVYSNADGTGVRQTTQVVTPCPTTAPFFLLGAGVAG